MYVNIYPQRSAELVESTCPRMSPALYVTAASIHRRILKCAFLFCGDIRSHMSAIIFITP